MRRELPGEVRRELSDPREVVRLLGLENHAIRQGGRGVTIICPWHDERSPSCSLHVGPDGTLAARCHGCGQTADVFGLIAAVHALSTRRDFVELVTIAAELAGSWHLVDELRGSAERRPPPPPKPRPELPPARDYPPLDEVRGVLARPASADPEICEYLVSRAIDPGLLNVASVGLHYDSLDPAHVAYAIYSDANLPRWARYQGCPWTTTGHRLLIPVVDAGGELRSVRACRVVDGDSPKRLPPSGCRAAELVMANPFALALLRGTWRPSSDVRVLVRIVEGEPDFLTAATTRTQLPTALFGIVSGSWTPAFAGRIPAHARVAIQTHADPAGEKYAADITATLTAAGVTGISRLDP